MNGQVRHGVAFQPKCASIVLALGASAAGVSVLQVSCRTIRRSINWIRGLPGWLALGYITIQLWMLLDSALRIRPTGVIDAVLAIAPVVTGIVMRRALDGRISASIAVPAQCAGDADRRPASSSSSAPYGCATCVLQRGDDSWWTPTRVDRAAAHDANAGARFSIGNAATSRIAVTGCGRSKPGTHLVADDAQDAVRRAHFDCDPREAIEHRRNDPVECRR